MKRAICSGSFDPVTNGHIDLFERAATMFDEVVVSILTNNKKSPLLSLKERLDLLHKVTGHLDNVKIDTFDGLLVEFAKAKKATAIVRGLRSSSDFDYEMNIASMNKELAPEIETVFFMTKPAYAFISSSIVKEAASYGSNVSRLVPKPVADALANAYKR
ncbi:pantetheine-phosphate adenylyltransferase [Shouchella patagoniensis]|uniref:pantetheine-phosphate adenylyltransferase n=1 Tax=Shouchella patagoniensis TaxID=228576 RepID=UPI0009955E7F|nr:pantetheine-phosphate adenylyltransferase [Shouchella patagoniensis]